MGKDLSDDALQQNAPVIVAVTAIILVLIQGDDDYVAHAWGTAPSCQQRQSSSWRDSRSAGITHLIISGGMPALSVAFPLDSLSMTLLSSSIVS